MSQVTVKSFEEAVQKVRQQIEAESFAPYERAQAEEIALIIAEIYRLPPECTLCIGGQSLSCSMVADIYSRLTCEHVREVMSRFAKATYPIRHKKTYLRTALYNEVFEHESGITNGVACVLF